jgi:hypothetical protein
VLDECIYFYFNVERIGTNKIKIKHSNPVTGPVVAQRGVDSSKTSALEGGEWSVARPARTLPPGKTRYPLYRRLVGPQGRSGRAENLAFTGIRSPDRPARSQSLYRLSYPAHQYRTVWNEIIVRTSVWLVWFEPTVPEFVLSKAVLALYRNVFGTKPDKVPNVRYDNKVLNLSYFPCC